MTCWGKCYVTFYFHAVLLMFFREWNTDWGITWGMRYSVMFICIKTSSKEEGMITFTRAPLCTSLRCVTAQTQEPELIAAAQVNAWVGFISARFWTVPEMALQGHLFSDLSYDIKDCQNTIYYLNFLKKKKKKLYSVCANSLVVSASTHSATVLTATWVRFSSRGPLPILLPTFLSSLYYCISIKKPIQKEILYSFERPVPKWFSTNKCTVTPLINTDINTKI